MSGTEKKKQANVVFDTARGWGNTVLNFQRNPEGEFMMYGDAYHRAGQKLLESITTKRGAYTLDVCPVVFLYRQALELHMKSIILHGNNFLSLHDQEEVAGNGIFTKHSLTTLLVPVEKILDFMEWKDGAFERGCIENFDDCKTVIEHFNSIDPGSYAFRYPVDTKGKGSVGEHFTFDVRIFAARLDPVIELFSTVSYALDHEYDVACEAIGEARQRAMEDASYDYDAGEVDYGDCDSD